MGRGQLFIRIKWNTVGQKIKILTNHLNFLLSLFFDRYFPPSAEHNGPQPIIGPLLLHPRQLVSRHDVLCHGDGVTLNYVIFFVIIVKYILRLQRTWKITTTVEIPYSILILPSCHIRMLPAHWTGHHSVCPQCTGGGWCVLLFSWFGKLSMIYRIVFNTRSKFGAEPTCDGSILCVLSDDVSHIAALAAKDFPWDFPLDSLRNIHWNEEC